MASESEKPDPDESFTQSVLGKAFLQKRWFKWFRDLPATYQVTGVIAVLAAVLYLPYSGAVGLWDPWETHYGEVAREMVHRRDYVHPWWESSWFFSKPPLTMWLHAIGMQVVGTNRTLAELAVYTEWGMRVPFVLLSIAALALLGLAVSRVASRRAGLAAAISLCTMPLYFLLTRQAVTDTPFVTTLVCAMSCAIIGQLDESTRHRAAWWYAFYVFAGLSTLAKGLLGFGLPAVILVLYAGLCVMPWDRASLDGHAQWLVSRAFRKDVREGKRGMPFLWGQFYRMKLGTGILVFLAVAGPWYAKLFLFEGVDEDGHKFWYRFLVHDHLNRLAAGVHTTTPGGSFIYFIEQGGYAMFPWVALLPGVIAVISRAKLRGGDKRDQLAILALAWALFSFGLVSLSATKFHHYVFPVLPPVAILIGLYVDRLWEEGIAAHAVTLMMGLLVFIMVGKDLSNTPKNFTDLFVYNYDRPYPTDLVDKPMSFFGRPRAMMLRDVAAILLIGFGMYFAADAFRAKQRLVGARATGLALFLLGGALLLAANSKGQLSTSTAVGLAVSLVGAYLLFEIFREKREGRPALIGVLVLVGAAAAGLIFYGLNITFRNKGGGPLVPDAVEVPLLQPVNLKLALGMAFTVAGGVCTIAALQRSRTLLFGSFLGLSVAFALWFNWGHWVELSHHWTQRDLFWKYYRQRGSPDEPIAAFLMNWRGETFYSRNMVKQIKDNSILGRFANQRGREWVLVEHNRFGILKSAVGADKTVTQMSDRETNNKFVLVKIE